MFKEQTIIVATFIALSLLLTAITGEPKDIGKGIFALVLVGLVLWLPFLILKIKKGGIKNGRKIGKKNSL